MREVKALFVPAEGDVRLMTMPDNLESILDVLGVDVIDVASTPIAGFYVDDEGLLNGSPMNPRASILYWLAGGSMANLLAGNALVMGRPDEEGYDTDVPEELTFGLTLEKK